MAAGDIVSRKGSSIVCAPSGGNFAFGITSLANNSGWRGAQVDLWGSANPPASFDYHWDIQLQCSATPTVNASLRSYLAWWNDDVAPGRPDAAAAATDGSVTSEIDMQIGTKQLDPVIVRVAAANTVFTASGIVRIPVRYISPFIWNASGAALTGTDSHHRLTFTQLYDRILQS